MLGSVAPATLGLMLLDVFDAASMLLIPGCLDPFSGVQTIGGLESQVWAVLRLLRSMLADFCDVYNSQAASEGDSCPCRQLSSYSRHSTCPRCTLWQCPCLMNLLGCHVVSLSNFRFRFLMPNTTNPARSAVTALLPAAS